RQIRPDNGSGGADRRGFNIDMQVQNLHEIQNRPLLLENAEKSDYRVIEATPVGASAAIIWPNLAHKDPKKRELLNTKDFRVALSHAIDREEIIDLIFLGQGEPWQLGPPKDHALYNEKLAKQFTEFDPETANQILDGLGFDQRDSDGFRLDKDGERISLFVEYSARNTQMGDIMELVAQYWANIGVETKIESTDNNFFQARNANWDDEIQINTGDNGGVEAIWRPVMYVPLEDDSRWAVPWAFWYLSGGSEGEEPPQEVKDRFAAYEKVRAALPGQEQEDAMRAVLDMTAEAFEGIGIASPARGQGIVKNGLKNVPDQMPYGFIYLVPQPTMPATYYWEDEARRQG
ncbi:MAG: ABC transporter substrate-binding protein, partial [Pseudomonadota bacterium]